MELDKFQVSLLHGLEVSGDGLRIFPPDDVVAAGATKPLISLAHFSFHAPLHGLFLKPMHVGTVHVSGMAINIPPRSRCGSRRRARNGRSERSRSWWRRLSVDDSKLVIGTDKPNKDPKVFELKRIVMRDVGPERPWDYDATLVNAVPEGDIHAIGTFGPWNVESPGDSTVTGHYTSSIMLI